MPDLRHDLELSENRRKKLKKDLAKLEKRLDETPKFIPIYDPVLREKDRRYQQEAVRFSLELLPIFSAASSAKIVSRVASRAPRNALS